VATKIKAKRVAARRRPQRAGPRRPTVAHRAREFVRQRFWVILGLVMLYLLVHDLFGDRGFLAMRRQQREVQKLQQEIQTLEEANRDLAGKVQRLKTDPEYIERLAREQMGLSRPGEHVFKLPPKEQAPEQATGNR
jgi:cell division protein FtsB